MSELEKHEVWRTLLRVLEGRDPAVRDMITVSNKLSVMMKRCFEDFNISFNKATLKKVLAKKVTRLDLRAVCGFFPFQIWVGCRKGLWVKGGAWAEAGAGAAGLAGRECRGGRERHHVQPPADGLLQQMCTAVEGQAWQRRQ
jgi:hypothetical protein